MMTTVPDKYERAIKALERIVSACRRGRDTGQGRRLVSFLGGLYNGPRFPFDLTDLRALDTDLRQACLIVLDLDSLCIQEIHTWGVVDRDELNTWLQANGDYYRAQQRRIGRELYEAKYGDDGHKDEGLSG